MDWTSTKIAYGETGYFTRIIKDYLNANRNLQPFYKHPVSVDGIKAAIADRKLFPADRKLLADGLQKKYTGEKTTDQQRSNIRLLTNTNCFTVTTAHQPNIFTGHLYFIYKILHAISLCEQLKREMPENDFVPVFFMGSEDADLDELGHVYIHGIKHEWKTNQTGAVGRMKIDKALVAILDAIEGEISVDPYGPEIIKLMKTCYTEGASIESATFKLVNALFGDYGLIVFLPDDPAYKKAFIPVVEKELTEQFSSGIVEETVSRFPKEYKVQAGGRDLNMFYLKDDKRERIEKRNKQYEVFNTRVSFTEQEIISELKEHPERFSPNVILRPVFQEMILPNIAFIGGGGELAYWLELRNVFDEVKVPFPVLILRNSFLLVEEKYTDKINSLGFKVQDMFKPELDLVNDLVKRASLLQLNLEKEKHTIHELYKDLRNTAGAVDKTLQAHTESLEKQALRKIHALEKKMLRAERKKFEAQQRQLNNLRSALFPNNNLQERVENFMPFYAKWGKDFINKVHENSGGIDMDFVVLELK